MIDISCTGTGAPAVETAPVAVDVAAPAAEVAARDKARPAMIPRIEVERFRCRTGPERNIRMAWRMWSGSM
ncbi:hypothetical protein GCM10009780_04230 [Actinomadura alba]